MAHGSTISNSVHVAKRSTLHTKVGVHFNGLLVDLVWQVASNLVSEWIHRNSSAPQHKIGGDFVFRQFASLLILRGVNNVMRTHGRNPVHTRVSRNGIDNRKRPNRAPVINSTPSLANLS
jgi:hypothetical protein